MREFRIEYDQYGHEYLYLTVQGDLYLVHKIRKAMQEADCKIRHVYEVLDDYEWSEIHFLA